MRKSLNKSRKVKSIRKKSVRKSTTRKVVKSRRVIPKKSVRKVVKSKRVRKSTKKVVKSRKVIPKKSVRKYRVDDKIRCNNNYICEYDMITYEPIENSEYCLSIEDDKCVTCESASMVRNSNITQFNKNPIRTIFGEDKGTAANERFWEQLKDRCKINRPSTSIQEESDFYIALPDFNKLDNYTYIIQNRIQEYMSKGFIKNINASNFINSIQKMVNSLKGVNFKDYSDPKQYIRNKFKSILKNESCSSQIIHEPIELPLSIEIFLSSLSEAPESGFILVCEFLDSKPQACLEAVIEKSINILNKSMNSNRKYRVENDVDKVKCCICEKDYKRDKTFVPLSCLQKWGSRAHRVCEKCWWNIFAKEHASHYCPGCQKGFPLTKGMKNKDLVREYIILDD